MPSTTSPITLEQFYKMPESEDGFTELIEGEIFRLPPPPHKHAKMLKRMQDLLSARLPSSYIVSIEVPFEISTDTYFKADVAAVELSRWNSADESPLSGSPELVIEVLSPLNTALEIERKRRLCLANGCRQFWTVFPEFVRVSAVDRGTNDYGAATRIPLAALSAGDLAIAEIFS